ncbi:hypothetical protein SPHV1_2310002 [Novosphingobium sp. KN65.2]|nr:hypothetical protein SPHV1_2310002 [Novosphingobium sp. KN65.2]
MRIMSDSLMAFQPSIDEPSNMRPSSSSSSPRTEDTIVRCCHLPLGSVKRRSTHSISSSLIFLRTSFALAISVVLQSCPAAARKGIRGLLALQEFYRPPVPDCSPVRLKPEFEKALGSEGVVVPFAGADAHRGLDRDDEDLAVADAAGLRGFGNRLYHAVRQGVGHDDLEFHLGQKVYDVLGTAIKLGMPLLTPEALCFGDGDARNAHFVKRFLHFIELERLDDGFDLFHACLDPCT